MAAALRALTTKDSYRDNAVRVSARIAHEDGAGVAVEAVEARVGTR
ncbi:hypothetical protein ACWDUL_29160 [Nocardia niigatensis]